MKKLFSEFKAFIMRGNVLDMAVGVIVATAFGKITTALVNNVFMPCINALFGSRNMSALDIVLVPEVVDKVTQEVTQPAIVLGLGVFVSAIIDFLLIALVVFLVVKLINTAREKLEKKKEEVKEEPTPPAPSNEEVLLTEIRDLLKEKQ